MVNDSADVASSWRSFHVCRPVTGSSSATNSRQTAGRHYQAIGADRTYPDASQWTTLYVNRTILNLILYLLYIDACAKDTCVANIRRRI